MSEDRNNRASGGAITLYGSDAYSPREIAIRVRDVGVAKARLPLLWTVLLAMLAGAFIGLGSLYYVVVVSDPELGWAARRVLGGAVFSLGLGQPVDYAGLARNLAPVVAGNLVGGSVLVALVYCFIYRWSPASAREGAEIR